MLIEKIKRLRCSTLTTVGVFMNYYYWLVYNNKVILYFMHCDDIIILYGI